jgi:hypothetical protein
MWEQFKELLYCTMCMYLHLQRIPIIIVVNSDSRLHTYLRFYTFSFLSRSTWYWSWCWTWCWWYSRDCYIKCGTSRHRHWHWCCLYLLSIKTRYCYQCTLDRLACWFTIANVDESENATLEHEHMYKLVHSWWNLIITAAMIIIQLEIILESAKFIAIFLMEIPYHGCQPLNRFFQL